MRNLFMPVVGPSSRPRPRLAAVFVASALVLAAGTTGARAAVEYDMVVIEPWDTSYSLATSSVGDLNNGNIAAGIAYDSEPLELNFYWSLEADKTRADIAGDELNDSGVTAGAGTIYWSSGDEFQVPRPDGGYPVKIRDLNNLNMVCGNALSRAFVWDDVNGSRYLEDLGNFPPMWRAYVVNDAGRVIGTRSTAHETWDQKAFAFDLDTLTFHDLHQLLNPSGAGKTVPMDVNELGVVVGVGSYDNDTAVAAFTWSAPDDITILPGLNGGLPMNVSPRSINDAGFVVGGAIDSEGEWRAFRWHPDEGMQDFEDLAEVPAGFNPEEAIVINDNDWIIGRGFWGTSWGPERAFVLVPRDEDATSVPALEHSGLELRAPSPMRGPSAKIEFVLERPGTVELAVFDVAGRAVAVLESGRIDAGLHTREWSTNSAPAGVYRVRLVSDGRVATTTIVRIP